MVVYYGSSRHFPRLGMSVGEGRYPIVLKALLEGPWTKCDHRMTMFKRIMLPTSWIEANRVVWGFD